MPPSSSPPLVRRELDAFLAAPIGAYAEGPTWLTWCASPQLAGSVFWGAPSRAELGSIARSWDHQLALRRYFAIMDLRGLRAVDVEGFGLAAAYLRTHVAHYAREVQRQILLLPSDPAVSALVAGLPVVLGYAHPWRAFGDPEPAFAWLDHPGARETHAALEQIASSAADQTATLHAMRHALAEAPATATLRSVSRAIGTSTRSLQRELGALGLSFRDELRAVRMRIAGERLRTSPQSLKVLAHSLGYRSVARFVEAFRAHHGRAPSEVAPR